MSEKKFLIVDDVDFNIEFEKTLIKKALKEKGVDNIEIDYANSVKEALEKIKGSEYKYFILDMNLPDGTGADIAKVVKEKNPNAKIVALTIYPSRYKKYKNLFDLYLHKPMKAENYIKQIYSLIEE